MDIDVALSVARNVDAVCNIDLVEAEEEATMAGERYSITDSVVETCQADGWDGGETRAVHTVPAYDKIEENMWTQLMVKNCLCKYYVSMPRIL